MRKESMAGASAHPRRGFRDCPVPCLLALVLLLISASSPASAWIFVFNSPGRVHGYGYDATYLDRVITDDRGDVYACGLVTYGGDLPARVTIVKLSGETGQPLWRNVLAGSPNYRSYNECRSVSLDGRGDLLVGAELVVGGYSIVQMVVSKLSGDGQTLWSRSFGDFNDRSRTSLAGTAIDSGGDVFAAGNVNAFGYGSTLLKLSGIGGTESWHVLPFPGQAYVDSVAMAVDSTGDVVLAGRQFVSQGSSNVILQKLAGTDGRPLWRYQQFRPILIRSTSVVVDESRDVYLADGTSVAKLSGNDGEAVWLRDVPASKVVLGRDGAPSALLPDGSGIAGLDPSSGREVWRRNEDRDHTLIDLVSDRASNVAVAGISPGPDGAAFSVSKVSGGDGRLLWRRNFPGRFKLSEADAVTVDEQGDVTAVGTGVEVARDAWGEEYLDSEAIVVKVWGRTGADYPPSASQILAALSDSILALHLPLNVERGLIDKIEAAERYLEDADSSNDSLAVRSIRILLSRLTALRGKTLSVSDADGLAALAEQALHAISASGS
jgi:hypothetical protein